MTPPHPRLVTIIGILFVAVLHIQSKSGPKQRRELEQKIELVLPRVHAGFFSLYLVHLFGYSA